MKILKEITDFITESVGKVKKTFSPDKIEENNIHKHQLRFRELLMAAFLGLSTVYGGACADNKEDFNAFGDKKIGVFLANFANTDQPELTVELVRDELFNKMNKYFIDNSYGKLSVSGDVFGWYQLEQKQSCKNHEVFREVKDIAENNNDLVADKYDYFAVIAPYGNGEKGCGWSGMGGGQLMSINSTSFNTYNKWGMSAHELQHCAGFDLNHASSLKDSDQAMLSISDLDQSSFEEYGDPFDIMGVSYYGFQNNAIHKEKLGWLTPKDIQIIEQDGVYTINALEDKSGIRALKIPRPGGDLYIEHRNPNSFQPEDFLDSTFNNVFQGALLHLPAKINGKNGSIDSALIHANTDWHNHGSPNSSALELGQFFVDPVSGKVLQVVEITPETLKIEIKETDQKDITSPKVNLTIEDDPRSNAKEPLEGIQVLIAEAQDESEITLVEFYIENNYSGHPASLGVDKTPPFEAELDLNKYLNDVVYNVFAVASDANPYPNQGLSDKIGIMVKNPDSENPAIQVLSPEENAIYQQAVPIEISVKDNKGIYSVIFGIDGIDGPSQTLYETNYTTTETNLTFKFSYTLDPRDHEFSLDVKDLGGNVAHAYVEFTVTE